MMLDSVDDFFADHDELPSVIMISGHAGSGKDTFAKMIKKHLSLNGQRVLIAHFGDSLKHICMDYLDWDGEKNEYGRQLLQMVGTDYFRRYDEVFFVRYLLESILFLSQNWDYVIIPDVRFPNEIEIFVDYFNVSYIRMYRNTDNGMTKDSNEHVSETALDNYSNDIVEEQKIINNGTLTDLDIKAGEWVKDYFARGF